MYSNYSCLMNSFKFCYSILSEEEIDKHLTAIAEKE